MFIRKKSNKSGSTSVQIVKKIGRSNRIIKTIGCSSDPKEIEQLVMQAKYDLPRLFGNTLFDKAPSIDIKALSNDDLRVIGPDIVFGTIFDKVGFNAIKDQLFRDLTISRITHPGSKLKLSEYLSATGKTDISVYSIYRFLDKLNTKYKNQVEDISFAHTKKLLDGKVGVVFYDMTTIYFESSEPDELRMTGFSKEGKHQNPQIYLGLLIGNNGYPIGYDIFEGNTFEGHTLIPVLNHFEARFDLKKPIVVADAGLLTKDNIIALLDKGYSFIIGARIKNESKRIIKEIQQMKLANGEIKKIAKDDGTKLFVSFSEKRAKKDAFNRERGLKKLKKNLNAGRLTKSNINNRGYNKYLKMEGEVAISIDYEKYDNDCKWDGLKGYITNTELDGKEVIDNYNNLWKIEKAFRISKTDLKIRPIYHRLRERIEAHISISFVSYILYKELERVLAKHNPEISINKAIEHINKMHEINVNQNGTMIPIRLKNNKIQQQICEIVLSEF